MQLTISVQGVQENMHLPYMCTVRCEIQDSHIRDAEY
jgi:hypothetical protein